MKSTGEVMGIDSDFGRAYAKAQIQAGNTLPTQGRVLVSMRTEEHAGIVGPVKELIDCGFEVVATRGTAETLSKAGLEVTSINKVHEGSPHCVDEIDSGRIQLVLNTVAPDAKAIKDSASIRRSAVQRGVPYCTTLAAARASASAVRALSLESIGVRSLQEIHAGLHSDHHSDHHSDLDQGE
jgi:carbamoyl-phosphate synthase large subunit